MIDRISVRNLRDHVGWRYLFPVSGDKSAGNYHSEHGHGDGLWSWQCYYTMYWDILFRILSSAMNQEFELLHWKLKLNGNHIFIYSRKHKVVQCGLNLIIYDFPYFCFLDNPHSTSSFNAVSFWNCIPQSTWDKKNNKDQEKYFIKIFHYLALPPVGWQRTVEQPAQTTTVWAWLKTVVILKTIKISFLVEKVLWVFRLPILPMDTGQSQVHHINLLNANCSKLGMSPFVV